MLHVTVPKSAPGSSLTRRFQLPEDSSWCSWAVVLLVAIAGRLVRKLCHFAGFGIADIVLGIAVSVLKYMLLLSVLFSAFDTLNEDYTLIGARTIEKSKSYKPVMRLSERIFPFLEWVGEQVPRQAREQDEE